MLRASAVALAVALVAPTPSGTAAETSGLEDANRRWRGARCRTRQEITVKKKADGDGWSRSEWLWYGPKKGGNERVLVLFTKSAAIHSRYPGGTIPPGVDLVGVGWATDGGDVYLELEHPDLGARARVFYYADWVGRVPPSRIGEFERWARLELLEILSTPDESLDLAAAPPPAAPPRAAPPPVAGAAGTTAPLVAPATGAVELRVLAASVEPARATPGAEVGLQVVYSVGGLAPNAEAEVNEVRVVRRDGATLTTLGAEARRPAGIHQSTQKLRLPADLAPGVYELEARIAYGGMEASGTAVFQVTAPGGR